MNPSAIYSKTGKGVQEASGKTSQLSRGDRAILSAIDGKTTLRDLGAKFDRAPDEKFFALIRKMDADGFIREVNPGMSQRGAANAPKAATSRPAAPPPAGGGEELDFTQIFSAPRRGKTRRAPHPRRPDAARTRSGNAPARRARSKAGPKPPRGLGGNTQNSIEAKRAPSRARAVERRPAEGKTTAG